MPIISTLENANVADKLSTALIRTGYRERSSVLPVERKSEAVPKNCTKTQPKICKQEEHALLFLMLFFFGPLLSFSFVLLIELRREFARYSAHTEL